MMVGKITAPQDVLIPKMCRYVTKQGKRDFADIIKLRILRWQILWYYLGEPSVITRILAGGKQECEVLRRYAGRDHKPRMQVDSRNKKWMLP